MTEDSEHPLIAALEAHPEVFDAADYACDEEELAELESAIGRELPADLVALLRVSDGGQLHGAHSALNLAPAAQILEWVRDGLTEALETIPFADDGGDTLVVLDSEGKWGTEGAVYRMEWNRRTVGGYPVQDVVRLADSLPDLIRHVAEGRDAW